MKRQPLLGRGVPRCGPPRGLVRSLDTNTHRESGHLRTIAGLVLELCTVPCKLTRMSDPPASRPAASDIVRPPDVPDDAIMRVLRVPPEAAGMRIDRFVQSQLRNTSRSRSQLIVLASAYSPDGRRLRKNRRLTAEERVVLWRPAFAEPEPEAALQSVYEDAHLLAVNKPPFVTVHPTARHHRFTVVKLLEAARPSEHITLLHRLDRDTSGVLLLARTRQADRAVKIQFERRRSVIKRYLALVWGWPEWEHHVCELPLEPDGDSRYRVKMRVARGDSGSAAGLSCATTFELRERRAHPESGRRYAMMECTLHTGRQHQIRVHLSALGLPIVGDKLYGPDEDLHGRGADDELTEDDLQALELPRHALHAQSLELDHPADGHRLLVEAPLYPDLAAFWDRLHPV